MMMLKAYLLLTCGPLYETVRLVKNTIAKNTLLKEC